MTFCGDLLFVPSGIHHHLFENLRRKGASLPRPETTVRGQTAKSFCLLLGKKFCGMCISPPGLAETVVAVYAPRRQGA
ncbi:hypothetical protein KZ773_24985 [Escherichia coli]|nr:hypothetical protein [Escherichia coli]